MPTQPQPGSNAEAIWQSARERAAVLGAFEPLELVSLTDDESEREDKADRFEALNALSAECSEILDGPAGLWRLDPDSRRSILLELDQSDRLVGLAKSLIGRAADAFGQHLLRAVLGRTKIPKRGAIDDLGALRNAVQFAAPLSTPTPPLSAVETAVTRRESEEAISFLLPGRLWGRDWPLRKMRTFVNGGFAKGKVPRPAGEVLAISGVGGSGKSAVLAEFARRTRRVGWDGVPIVWLDFDRVSLASADALTLMLEFVRQFALYRDDLAAPLARFRDELRQRSTVNEVMTFSLRESRTSEMWSLWKGFMEKELPVSQPVLLILDTYEEILLRSDGRDEEIRRWIDDLAIEGLLTNLLPIFSGRAFPKTWIEGLGDRLADKIALQDLRPISALRLLEDDLARDGQAPDAFPLATLVEHFGGNPLMLKILSRYLIESGPAAANSLLEGGKDGALQERFSKGFLYERILKRLRVDVPALQRLAHPGLTLRRVTADLIQKVLAGPCELGEIDGKRAEALFRQLSRQVWLVDSQQEQTVVYHRRDLRRLVLNLMSKDDRKASLAIHAAAAHYYAERSDPLLSDRDQAIEAAYHGFFVPDVERPPETAFRELAQAFGSDVNDLPPLWRARLKFSGGKSLTPAELDTLDDEQSASYAALSERSFLSRASPSAKRSATMVEALSESSAAPFISIEREFATGNLEVIARHGERAVNEFAMRVFMPSAEHPNSSSELTTTPLWRVGMAVRSSEREELGQMLRHEVERRFFDVEWAAPFDRFSKQSLNLIQATGALFGLLATDPPDFFRERLLREEWIRIDSIDSLRASQLCRKTIGPLQSSGVSLRIGLLRYLDPEFLKFARKGSWLDGEVTIALSASTREMIIAGLDIGRRSTAPVALHEVQRLRADSADMFVTGPIVSRSRTAGLLLGITPELYPPIQAVLEEGPDKPLNVFAARASKRRELWPAELQGPVLKESLKRDRARSIGTMIEIADRAAMLEDLLEIAAREMPSHGRIRAMKTTFKSYRTAIS